MAYFMEYKKTYEEFNILLPFRPDVKIQQTQGKSMVVIGFLVDLPSEYDLINS